MLRRSSFHLSHLAVKVTILTNTTLSKHEKLKSKYKLQKDNFPSSNDNETDTRKMGTVNWRQVARDRDGWRRATREALILLR
jgi:hypothetical protein